MPIELDSPIVQPEVRIAKQTIASFTCDPLALTVSVRMTHLDANGNRVADRDFDFTCPLVLDGKPRFTPEFYDELKALIYRLGIEDGHLVGMVV